MSFSSSNSSSTKEEGHAMEGSGVGQSVLEG